jgi:hypothetical protein
LLATLTRFNSSGLLQLAVKLLNLPTHGTHLLRVIRGVLSQVVSDDILRLVARDNDAEQFHLLVCAGTLGA